MTWEELKATWRRFNKWSRSLSFVEAVVFVIIFNFLWRLFQIDAMLEFIWDELRVNEGLALVHDVTQQTYALVGIQ